MKKQKTNRQKKKRKIKGGQSMKFRIDKKRKKNRYEQIRKGIRIDKKRKRIDKKRKRIDKNG